MSDTLYYTTEMPTESFDDLKPEPAVIEKRENGKPAPIQIGSRHTDSAVFLDDKEEMECRIALLEVAFQNYALEIRDRISQRLLELEEKLALQNGELRDVLREESAEREEALASLSASVSNAIDRVERNTLAASGMMPKSEQGSETEGLAS